jgi:hypothetical protein
MKQKFYTTGSMAYNWFTRFLVLACLLFGFGSAWAATINGGTKLYLKPNAG